MQKQRSEANQIFYAAPGPIARVLCAIFLSAMALVYAACFFLMPAEEAQSLLLPLLPLIGVGLICEIGMGFLLSRLSPIRLGEAGITLTNFLGCKQTLSWGEMESAAVCKFASMRYLKISSVRPGHAPLALPLLLTRPWDFADAIRDFASPIHPVRRFIEDVRPGLKAT